MEGNDEDDLTFITLSAATQNVIRYLKLAEEKKPSGQEGEAGRSDEGKDSEQLEIVQRRLRELRAFERRAAGNGPRRKRN